MLIWIILFIVACGLAALYWSLTEDKRKRKKERNRIAKRLEEQSAEERARGEAIQWVQVKEALDALQIASGQTQGMQFMQELAFKLEHDRLFIEKNSEKIKVQDVEHLQSLVNTYDPLIKITNYIGQNEQAQTPITEYAHKDIQLNSKQQAFIDFANLLSDSGFEVANELVLYFSDPQKYFDKYYFDLAQRGIDNLAQLPDIVVLVDELSRHNKVVYQDCKSELYSALQGLDEMVNGQLSRSENFQRLYTNANVSLVKLSVLEEPKADVIFACIKSCAYRLLSIHEDSDAYILFVIGEENLAQLLDFSEKAGIRLDFKNKL